MSAQWHWLVVQGLVKDLIAAAVGVVVGHVFAWRPLRNHRRRLDRIADLLDTGTPGGLADVARAVQDRPGTTGKAGK